MIYLHGYKFGIKKSKFHEGWMSSLARGGEGEREGEGHGVGEGGHPSLSSLYFRSRNATSIQKAASLIQNKFPAIAVAATRVKLKLSTSVMFGMKGNYSKAIAACPRSFRKKICFSSLKRINKEIFAEKRDAREEKKRKYTRTVRMNFIHMLNMPFNVFSFLQIIVIFPVPKYLCSK